MRRPLEAVLKRLTVLRTIKNAPLKYWMKIRQRIGKEIEAFKTATTFWDYAWIVAKLAIVIFLLMFKWVIPAIAVFVHQRLF